MGAQQESEVGQLWAEVTWKGQEAALPQIRAHMATWG